MFAFDSFLQINCKLLQNKLFKILVLFCKFYYVKSMGWLRIFISCNVIKIHIYKGVPISLSRQKLNYFFSLPIYDSAKCIEKRYIYYRICGNRVLCLPACRHLFFLNERSNVTIFHRSSSLEITRLNILHNGL